MKWDELRRVRFSEEEIKAIDAEAAARLVDMRARGHKPLSDEEAQANLDATLYAIEWDPREGDK